MKFKKELQELINKHSMENESNTPDFLLADYIRRCMDNFTKSVRARDEWYNQGKRSEDENAS